MAISTLKKRSEFLAVRGGARWSCPAFLMEAKSRAQSGTSGEADGEPRFGFTITKKLGTAVVRNRMRRRLRAALAEIAPKAASPGFDYVVVARPAALERPFEELKGDFRDAFARVHRERRRQRS